MSRLLPLSYLHPLCLTIAIAGTLAGPVLAQDAKAEAARIIPIWPGIAPGSETWTQKEVEYQSSQDKRRMVRNVVTPTLTAFLPDPANATGAAIIVCPGGGFRFLSWDNEGTEVAAWLQKRGVAAFVLKYRTVETAAAPDAFGKQMAAFFAIAAPFKERGSPDGWKGLAADLQQASPAGIADGKQAIRLLRERTSEWGIKPDKIGIMGFSAGGIVTQGVALEADAASRPNFAAAIYAPYFGEPKVPANAPPLFLLCAADDLIVEAGAVRLYTAWRDVGRSAELHIYETGGHGFGMTSKGQPIGRWTDRLGDWMTQRGFLKPKG